MLLKIFEEIKQSSIKSVKSGSDFEYMVKGIFAKYSKELKSISGSNFNDVFTLKHFSSNTNTVMNNWNNVKNFLICNNHTYYISNPWPHLANSFIFQPYGSQQIPDFIYFTKDYIIPIECKFVSGGTSKPKWNSNILKFSYIYILGAEKFGITTFLSGDIVNSDLYDYLHNIFEKIEDFDKLLLGMNSAKLSNNFGIIPYIRKDFIYNVSFSSYVGKDGNSESFFGENRFKRERDVLNKLKRL